MIHKARLGGWCRLWVVLTALYGIVVLWFAIADGTRLVSLVDNEILAAPASVSASASAQTKHSKLSSQEIDAILDEAKHSKLSSQEIDAILDEALSSIGKVTPPASGEDLNALAVRGFLLWVVPSFAVLALGYATRWVARGFKATYGRGTSETKPKT